MDRFEGVLIAKLKGLSVKAKKIGKSQEPTVKGKSSGKELIDVVNSQEASDGHLSHAILSDGENGFLFVPGVILPSANISDINSFLKDEKFNASLFDDIKLSQSVASILCGELTGKYGAGGAFSHDAQPSNIDGGYRQSYVIFRSGITRLCESDPSIKPDSKAQRDYYKNKSTSKTLLQTRHYFEPTVDSTEFFYSTEPYIDLGGNGIVQTFCHYIPVRGSDPQNEDEYRTDAVLCFDFPLNVDITKSIVSQLASFGGAVVEFDCKNDTCTSNENAIEDSETADVSFMRMFFPQAKFSSSEKEEVTELYQEAHNKGNESIFFGRTSTLKKDSKAGLIKILLPRGKTHVVAIKFDLASYEQWRILWLSLAAACIAITLILALLILADYGLKFKEQERAFSVVDSVMSDVPAPYARLDEDGKFLKVNDCFSKLMGYQSAAEATVELRKYKYEEFLADDASKEEFHRIKEERKEGKKYRSYIIQLWTGRTPGRPPIKWIKVHGGDVPTPHSSRNLVSLLEFCFQPMRRNP